MLTWTSLRVAALLQKRNFDWLDDFFKLRIKIRIRDFPEPSQTNVCTSTSDYYLPMSDPDCNIKCQPKAFVSVMYKVEM